MVPGGFTVDERVVYVRFEGKSTPVAFSLIGVANGSSDQEVREAVARYLGVPARRLDSYIVERHPNGDMTVQTGAAG